MTKPTAEFIGTLNVSFATDPEQDSEATRIYWALELSKNNSIRALLLAFGKGDDEAASGHLQEVESYQEIQNALFELAAQLVEANYLASNPQVSIFSVEDRTKSFISNYRKDPKAK
ncbi:hypothetical protein EXU85_20285 [Spirosoma sp. KCTC 42546]|uniref:hypothetical protein n=1 Tax=Spirosoma sp. KCTC 42546 TaxID=2520506 RepID=UPI001157F906|nr:hypothetical protein [Spirosoma sp. KCTC 42546]QDK80818.1 hypothetical protein EXU85_20285 [Spirosoma sp. KCTC 42546]